MVKHNKVKSKVSQHQQHQKKRPRSTSESSNAVTSNQAVAANENNDATTDSQNVSIVTATVVQWLESRKKSVPSVLQRENAPTDMDQILKLLPDLRERERRALIRKVAKTLQSNDGTNNESKHQELDGSDNEYSENDVTTAHTSTMEWPLSSVEFSNNYRWDASVPQEIKDKYYPTNDIRHRVNRLSSKVYFKRITDSNHPACGEYGLFCALPNGAPPGTWLLDYVGHVTLGEDQNKQSDYVSDFGEHSELACDANAYGNEARFLNDFRNTGRVSFVCWCVIVHQTMKFNAYGSLLKFNSPFALHNFAVS